MLTDVELTLKAEIVVFLLVSIHNGEFMVMKLFNNVLPLTFNVPKIFVSFDNVVNPDTFNELLIVDSFATYIRKN